MASFTPDPPPAPLRFTPDAPTAGDAAMGALGTIGHGITGLATVLESTYGIPAGVLAKYVTMGGNLAHLTTMSPQEAQQHVQNSS